MNIEIQEHLARLKDLNEQKKSHYEERMANINEEYDLKVGTLHDEKEEQELELKLELQKIKSKLTTLTSNLKRNIKNVEKKRQEALKEVESQQKFDEKYYQTNIEQTQLSWDNSLKKCSDDDEPSNVKEL